MIIATPDRILYYGTLPIDGYPLAVLRCKCVPGMFFGKSVIEDLIPLQRAYNGVKNKLHDYIRSLSLNPLLVPEGRIGDVDELAQNGVAPGDIVEYDPTRGEPKPLSAPQMPSGIFEECDNLAREMEYAAGLSHLGATGNNQSSLTSATAIERLREIDGVRLALTGDNIRAAILAAAKIWLKLYRAHGSVTHIEKWSAATTHLRPSPGVRTTSIPTTWCLRAKTPCCTATKRSLPPSARALSLGFLRARTARSRAVCAKAALPDAHRRLCAYALRGRAAKCGGTARKHASDER